MTPNLSGSEVWRIRVGDQLARWPQHWQRLDAMEQARATRFHQAADRHRFVIGRSTLREHLGRLLGVGAWAVRFGKSRSDKPTLRAPPADLHFNLSHSGDWVLLAFCRAGPVGIDVEAHRPAMARLEDFDSIMSAEERDSLQAVAPAGRVQALARLWVRKEAYVKALGDGLSRSLPDISIVPAADGSPHLLYDRNPDGAALRWSFIDIEVDETHAGCLVQPQKAGPPRVYDYPASAA